MYQSVCSFGSCWAEYNAALEAWKAVDIDRLVEELFAYWEQLQVSKHKLLSYLLLHGLKLVKTEYIIKLVVTII